jgi:hypothetical protein
MSKGLQRFTHLDLKARSYTYRMNHHSIIAHIESCLAEGFIPSITDIKEHTCLSRQTIYKHLRELPLYCPTEANLKQEEVVMAQRRKQVVDALYKQACCGFGGDIQAARLFMQLTDPERKNGNCIQINNFYINQATFNKLEENKQKAIIDIILGQNL